jgi:membrane-associated phospholipid phosphatase
VRAWLVSLTNFGHIAVLMPVAAAILIWLCLYFSRAAPRWLIALGLCIGLTALLKIFFYAWPLASDIHNPSGHTSLSTLTYGTLTLAAAGSISGARRLLVIAGGAALILAIAASRLLLGIHTAPEVGLGLFIGVLSLALFTQKYLQGPNVRVWPLLVVAGVLVSTLRVLFSILHGRELHAEQLLHRLSGHLQLY